MAQQLIDEITRRQITRICHFTSFRNAHRIFQSQQILCTARIKNEHAATYNPTDRMRWDDKETHICTSVEYPNVWYLDRTEAKDDVWIDYMILLIDPNVMTRDHVEFCTSNAARQRGATCAPGADQFKKLFAPTVTGQSVFRRGGNHPLWLPTDMQAEVLIADAVALDDVTGILVRAADAAERLLSQIALAETTLKAPLLIAPGAFDQGTLRALRTGGRRPQEELYSR